MTSPTSVLLPTVAWTDACAEVADQLGPDDELLVVHDGPDDPVADRAVPDGVRLVAAGEPEGCSGKANAIAVGMETAAHDRIVWTDDDFHHPPDWLATLQADYAARGPVSELPVFVGRDPLALLLEPFYLLGGTLGTYANDQAWGGAVIFERSDLDDEAAFLGELRRTVSDDGLLSEHLDVTSLKRTRRVEVGGTIRETLERHVRFSQIVSHHDPRGSAGTAAVLSVAVACAVLFPLPTAVVSTLLAGAVAAAFGVRRPTVLLAYPSLFLAVPLGPYSLARRTFAWGGRRYRWRSKFDVAVVE